MKKNKLLKISFILIIIVILLQLIIPTIFAKSEEVAIIYDCGVSDNIAIIQGIINKEDLTNMLEIPSKLKSYEVIAIYSGAFDGCDNLKEIILPNTIQYIDDNVFDNMSVVYYPEEISQVINEYNGSFNNFQIKKQEEIYENDNSMDLFIKIQLFLILVPLVLVLSIITINLIINRKKHIEIDGIIWKYKIKDNKVTIYGIKNKNDLLTKIVVPNNINNNKVVAIGDLAFNQCKTLTEVEVLEGIKQIGKNAFSCCENLTKVILPEKLSKIDDEAFRDCGNLQEINIPNSVNKIGMGAFGACSRLNNILLPEKLKTIEDFTFIECKSLQEINLPEGITYIGLLAFCECDNLKELRLPKTIKNIDTGAFEGVKALVYYPDTISKIINENYKECDNFIKY